MSKEYKIDEPGTCPRCKKAHLDYKQPPIITDDNDLYYEAKCEGCGFLCREVYSVIFKETIGEDLSVNIPKEADFPKTKERMLAVKKGFYFESSSGKTEEFTAFARTFRSEAKKACGKISAELVNFSVGHFECYGFVQRGGRFVYFSISDVRHFPETCLLIRTAKDARDFTGGSNRYCDMGDFSKAVDNLLEMED